MGLRLDVLHGGVCCLAGAPCIFTQVFDRNPYKISGDLSAVPFAEKRYGKECLPALGISWDVVNRDTFSVHRWASVAILLQSRDCGSLLEFYQEGAER